MSETPGAAREDDDPQARADGPAATADGSAGRADGSVRADSSATADGPATADGSARADRVAAGGAFGGRRGLMTALLLGAVGATLVLVAGGETWASGAARVAGSRVAVSVDGKAVGGLPDALALVGLAALVAVLAVRGVARAVVSGVLALSGAGIVWAVTAGASGTGALDRAAGRASGLTSATAAGITHTAWPWAAAAGGLLLLLAGLLAVARGASWPGMSARYERGSAGAAPGARRGRRRLPDPESPGEMWKALDRGEDPTA